MNIVHDKNTGWGITFGKTNEFFDSKKKFFVNGEITIKVKGFLKAQRPKTYIISAPISMKWKIKKEEFKEA
uniref:Uncharacterized protein n=1 Tax=Panagrolaimus sp. PS1159 TaxID=55785 RepID=A0AC35GJ64_9BILA